jgi:hypothetical protein
MSPYWKCLGLTLVVSAVGCTSLSSTMLNRLDDNSFVGNSNGDACSRGRTRPFKGVPITLQVPSHVDVSIDETYYLANDATTGTLTELPIGRILNVRTEVIKTKKVFIVDFKRPASGTLNLDAKFNDDQYLKSITSHLEDTTIKDSAALLGTVLKFATGKQTSGTQGPAPSPNFSRQTRTVAYRRFDINEPDFEGQVDAFVSRHLNNCNESCEQVPTYDRK